MKTSRVVSGVQAIPQTMKAAAIDEFGPSKVLKLHTLPVPEPGPREVLIALHTAGVGVWDTSIRDGSWQPTGRPRFPIIPGTDGAGFVAAVGSGARQFRAGERVYAYEYANPKGAFYAEYESRACGACPGSSRPLAGGHRSNDGLDGTPGNRQ